MKRMINTAPIRYTRQTSELLYYVDELCSDFNSVNNLTRKIDKRKKVIASIEELLELTRKYKKEIIRSEQPGKCANRILAIELVLESWLHSLEMWNHLRNEDWNKAWSSLFDVDRKSKWAVQADELGLELDADILNRRILAIEKVVFPPGIYTSAGFNTGKSICSICDSDYSDCDHIKGRAYNGKMCFTELRDITHIDHLALVDKPANKLQRIGGFE